jgi:hypothetical protein
MRTFTNVLAAIAVFAATSTFVPAQAAACPQGYFQCGKVCCPGR